MRVLHPDGARTLDVMAHSALDARLQASNAWNMTAQEFDACKVMVENAALGREIGAEKTPSVTAAPCHLPH